MGDGFRASMDWLHTWTGVVLGALLFAIFWTGTLSVFDREIDRWMAPATRLALPDETAPLESLRPLLTAAEEARSPVWSATLPTERMPVFAVAWRERGATVQRLLDPASGRTLPDSGSFGGTRFLYPFHYMLHIRTADIGYWIVGLAAMAMMAMCVSGVVIHRKIFADFFVFRPRAGQRRQLLDLHNVMGVLGLPFHFLISLSGVVILFTVYFPMLSWAGYGRDQAAFLDDTYGMVRRPPAGSAAPAASLDAMAAGARTLLGGAPLMYVIVRNPGDRQATVQVARLNDDRITRPHDILYFGAADGALLARRTDSAPMMDTHRFVSGLHLVQFRHWTLRWVYFVLGLAGCVVIATGYLYWLDARERRHATKGVRLVRGLAIGSVTGLLVATLAFFVANRLLPLGAALGGLDRAGLEGLAFYATWLVAFVHAWARPRGAWRVQCLAIASLAVAAVVLNWITTGDHPGRSLAAPHLWPVAGMDLLLLAMAALAFLAARKLGTERAGRVARA